MPRWVAYVLAVTSSLGFATVGVFARFGYAAHLTTLTLLTWRFTGAGVVLAVWALSQRQRWPSWRESLWLGAMGVVGYTTMSWLFFVGNRLAPVGLVSSALYTYPALVTLALRVLGLEPMDRSKLVALIGTGVGAALVVLLGRGALAGGVDPLVGLLAGFGAAVVYAAYITAGTPLLSRVRAPVAAAVVMGAAALALWAVDLARGASPFVPVADWWIVLGLVFPSTVWSVLGFFLAMQGLGSGRAAIVSSCEPVGAVLLGWWVFGQTLSLGQLVGVALVVAGGAALLRGEERGRPAMPRDPARLDTSR